MLFTLAAVVFFAAIITFFSQEFIRVFKKIFAIKGAKLLIPLAVASWFMYSYDYLALAAISYYREALNAVATFLTDIIPLGSASSYVAFILLLTIISVVPVFVLDWFHRKKNYKPYPFPYTTSSLIWIINALILIISPIHLALG